MKNEYLNKAAFQNLIFNDYILKILIPLVS